MICLNSSIQLILSLMILFKSYPLTNRWDSAVFTCRVPRFGLRPGTSSGVPVQGERASGKRPESTLKSSPFLSQV